MKRVQNNKSELIIGIIASLLVSTLIFLSIGWNKAIFILMWVSDFSFMLSLYVIFLSVFKRKVRNYYLSNKPWSYVLNIGALVLFFTSSFYLHQINNAPVFSVSNLVIVGIMLVVTIFL